MIEPLNTYYLRTVTHVLRLRNAQNLRLLKADTQIAWKAKFGLTWDEARDGETKTCHMDCIFVREVDAKNFIEEYNKNNTPHTGNPTPVIDTQPPNLNPTLRTDHQPPTLRSVPATTNVHAKKL